MPHKAHLSKDKHLKKLVNQIELPEIKPQKNVFIALISSIVSQQLSTKVADIIFARFLALYGKKKPTPQQVLDTPFENLRAIGLSNQKAQYILNIAQFALDNNIKFSYLQKMSNEDLIAYFTQIKGVGVWTVEMFLMFTLAREDVFSLGDYGLLMGTKELYALNDTDKKSFLLEVEKISKKWSPYRTYAAMYLWRFRDTK